MRTCKIIWLMLLCAIGAFADDFGILVNGHTYFAGEYKGKDTNTGQFDEYKAKVTFNTGDYFQLCNAVTKETWSVALDEYSVTGFVWESGQNRYKANTSGCFDCYIKLKSGHDQLYIGNGQECGSGEEYSTHYSGSVPYHCGAVIIQAFYNESYKEDAPGVSTYGDTKWTTLLSQADELGRYFDYVWLPPSAYGDGMGYHPLQYSNQNSNWGTREELDTLITALHEAGAKVVADIVINHCAGWDSWCDFPVMDFGEFGTFNPDASYICNNDEVNWDSNKERADSCWGIATGRTDDGQNWDGARDWAHDDPKVQKMFIAYLKWMRQVMKYDGFRYDKGDGFNNWHHDNYNKHAKPEIAFMESYNGNDEIIREINQANKNMMALDFQTRWKAFWENGNGDRPNTGIGTFDYSGCKGSGLLGAGYAAYAVTFIDSHDWFLRSESWGQEFGGYERSMSSDMKDRLMQANAFMLGMPGVPCIFYPHWHKYKDALKPMIEARKLAGVHSNSPVSDESAEGGGYQCTVKGKDGWLILMLGNKTKHEDQAWDPAYRLVAKGPGYAMWVNRTTPIPTGNKENENRIPPTHSTKTILNGQLIIEHNGVRYNIFGKRM